MKVYFVPLVISAIVLVAYFSISPALLQENSLSKQCEIPHDDNFIDRRSVISTPNDGKLHYSIKGEFSIYHTVPIGSYEVDRTSHSLILKPVPNSYGYIIMCDPLPVLQKRFNTAMNKMMILVDGKETEYDIINDVLKLDVNNNTRFEIIVYDDYPKYLVEQLFMSALEETNDDNLQVMTFVVIKSKDNEPQYDNYCGFAHLETQEVWFDADVSENHILRAAFVNPPSPYCEIDDHSCFCDLQEILTKLK